MYYKAYYMIQQRNKQVSLQDYIYNKSVHVCEQVDYVYNKSVHVCVQVDYVYNKMVHVCEEVDYVYNKSVYMSVYEVFTNIHAYSKLLVSWLD